MKPYPHTAAMRKAIRAGKVAGRRHRIRLIACGNCRRGMLPAGVRVGGMQPPKAHMVIGAWKVCRQCATGKWASRSR